jgi:hypothetical protein
VLALTERAAFTFPATKRGPIAKRGVDRARVAAKTAGDEDVPVIDRNVATRDKAVSAPSHLPGQRNKWNATGRGEVDVDAA